MPRSTRNTPILPQYGGRRQADRPALETPKSTDGERALPGAMSVPIEQITPDPDQPREDHGAESRTELAQSLREYGVLQPLLVREVGYLEDGRTRYMVVAGGRRYAAAQLAGLTRLPVVVRDTEGAALRMTQLIENIQRQDLAPLEEARAFQELMDAEGLSAKALGERLHISGQHVRDRLLLLSDQAIADAVQSGQIGPTVARDVLHLADEAQAPLRQRIHAGETLDTSDVKRARAAAATAGVTNPRAAGGVRRPRKEARDGVTSSHEKQTTFASPASTMPASAVPMRPQATVDAFDKAIHLLDAEAVDALVTYGVERGWSCQKLLRAIQERRA